MNILIAPDKFKDALSATAACEAIWQGLKYANPDFEIHKFPLSDGGEGTAEILTYHTRGTTVSLKVHDPLFRPVDASYGISDDGKTAFIEMAAASGLKLLKPEERNCLYTSTAGTGEMIVDAVNKGAKKIILGLGGSATNDAGIGMAAALGYKFYDHKGNKLEPIGKNLIHIAKIEATNLKIPKGDLEVLVACDVENPLFGPNGAARVYASQKGAEGEGIEILDAGLKHFAQLAEKTFHEPFSTVKGAGAAGGLGAGAMWFLGGKLTPGVNLIMAITQFEKALKKADLVITGEGKIDRQTLSGKLIKGIADAATQYNIPVIAFCGTLEDLGEDEKKLGLSYVTSILTRPSTREEALKNTASDLMQAAYNMGKLINTLGQNKK